MRRKFSRVILAIFLMSLLAIVVTGCGKKKNKDINEPTETTNNKTETVSNKQEKKEPQKEKEEVVAADPVNLNSSIVTVERYIQDELCLNDIGYMRIEYVELDDEAAKLCPNLAKSIKEFNESRKKEFEESYPRFVEASEKYADYLYESGYYDDENANYEQENSCEDYEELFVMRADSVAMSMLTAYTDFWGTGKKEVMYVGVTYDSATGKRLEITDVVANWDEYEKAIDSELSRKYGSAKLNDVDHKDYLGWVLTPEGIIIYYADGYVTTPDGGATCVQINFDEYPKVLNEKYAVAPDEYAFPFGAYEPFYMDADGDGESREEVIFSPMEYPGGEGSGEYAFYEISVNGGKYTIDNEDWFYAFCPYYVHTQKGNYIYVHTLGYDQDQIYVNSFIGRQPICEEALPAIPLYVKTIDDMDEEFICSGIAFTNPAMIKDSLSFDTNICGIYSESEVEEDGEYREEWEARDWEICNIDGKYYLDYVGGYDFAAAEIELLDETPYLVDEELRYMVRVYPYSGFSFAGDYWGEGHVMYIATPIGDDYLDCIRFSEGNPFTESYLYASEDSYIHEVQNNSHENTAAPEIIGSWRGEAKADSKEYKVYMQFSKDGHVDIVCKCENYTPTVYRGVYDLKQDGKTYKGTIEAEAMGMGTQPMADWTIEFDPKSDNPITITSEYEDGNPIVYGADAIKFRKTEAGEYGKFIHPGPWKRTAEVADAWEEYLSMDDEHITYDFSPEYIDAVHDKALNIIDGTSYTSYGIQDNGCGGEIWIKIMRDEAPSVQVTKNWLRYDFGEGCYYDIYDSFYGED